MGQNRDYQNAYNNYINTINDYTKVGTELYNTAYKNSRKYIGDKGYNRALELGKKGATSASNSAISQGINSARASGMNKAQASAMGNQSAINTYGNQLLAQQQNAYNSGRDSLTNEYNRANGIGGIYANRSNLAGQGMNSQQVEGSNIFTRLFGGAGAIGNIFEALSDERLKKYKDLSTSFCSKKDDETNTVDTDSILKFKINLTKYKGEQ